MATIISKIVKPFEIYYSVFESSVYKNATLWIPVGTIDEYKAQSTWNEFLNMKEGYPTGIHTITLDNYKKNSVYELNGRRLESPQKGINIIGGKKVVMK